MSIVLRPIREALGIVFLVLGLPLLALLFIVTVIVDGLDRLQGVFWRDKQLPVDGGVSKAALPLTSMLNEHNHADPRYGSAYWPKQDRYVHRFGYHQIVGDDAWKGGCTLEAADIVVVGDSFAAGMGIDYERCYYHPRARGPRIKPIAVDGWNLSQEAAALKDLAQQNIEGKLVIWLPFLFNDITNVTLPVDNWGTAAPFMRQDGPAKKWRLDTSHLRADDWDRRAWLAGGNVQTGNVALGQSFVIVDRPNHLIDRGIEAASVLIDEAAKAVTAAGAQLIMVTQPASYELASPWIRKKMSQIYNTVLVPKPNTYLDERLQQICEAHGVPFLRGREFLSIMDFNIREPHLNRRGHVKLRRLFVTLWQWYQANRGIRSGEGTSKHQPAVA